MLVSEFLERTISNGKRLQTAIPILMDLLSLFDYFADEKCSVVAGKIRATLDKEAGK